MDTARLCVRLCVADTACRRPHLVPDIVTCLSRRSRAVTVLSVDGPDCVLRVDGQVVHLRYNDHWYSVVCGAKAVVLSPLRTATVVVAAAVRGGGPPTPIHDHLYADWAAGVASTLESVKERVPEFAEWVSGPVVYAEPSAFAEAVEMVVESSSVA